MAMGRYESSLDRYAGNNVFNSFFDLPKQMEAFIGEGSWSSRFYREVTMRIDESIFEPLYSGDEASRPSTPARLVVAALVLKALHRLDDAMLLENCITSFSYRKALGLGFFEDVPFSKNTFSNFRARLARHQEKTGDDLLKEQFKSISQEYCGLLGIDGKKVRIDSMMIDSRGKYMTRLGIVVSTNILCVQAIASNVDASFVPEGLARYLRPDYANSVVYHQEEGVVGSRMQKAIDDSLEIKRLMEEGEHPWLVYLDCYDTLVRMLSDQTVTDADGTVRPADKQDISAGSMQNPHDQDATYRNKAGKGYHGYVANIVAAYEGKGASIVVDYAYEKNTTSDPQMLLDYIEAASQEGKAPEEAVADGAYYTPETAKAAEEAGIRLHATSLAGPKPNPAAAGAVFSEDGKTLEKCGAGNKPLSQSLQKDGSSIRFTMSKETCNKDCRFFSSCNPKEQQKSMAMYTSKAAQERALHVEALGTEESKQKANERNAVEGIPSELRNVFHADSIPVAGQVRSGIFFSFMVMGRNFKSLLNNTTRGYLEKKRKAVERKGRLYREWKAAAAAA